MLSRRTAIKSVERKYILRNSRPVFRSGMVLSGDARRYYMESQ